MKTYTTNKGETFNLDDLSPKEREFLDRARKLYDRGAAWDEFQNFYLDRQSAIWFEGGDPQAERLATTKVTRTPLYRILQDMAGELGVEQGYLREAGPSGLSSEADIEDFRETEGRDAGR